MATDNAMSKGEGLQSDKDGEGLIERLRNLPRLSVCVEAADCIEKLEHDLERATANHATDLTPRSAEVASVTVAVGNVLDRWEGVPNDLKDAIRDADSGFEQAMDALEDAQASTPPSAKGARNGLKCLSHEKEPSEHWRIEFADGTDMIFAHFSEFGAFLMQRERGSLSICLECGDLETTMSKYCSREDCPNNAAVGPTGVKP